MSHTSSQTTRTPKIGIALGSGSARGWAHIGVIRGLAELGIEPDIVAGTSIGALVGAAYASDQLDLLEQWALSLNWKDLVSYLDLGVLGGGVIEGEKLLDFFSKHINHFNIEDMPKKFAAVATELDSGREVWLQSGSVAQAVRASMALPGLFSPFRHEGRWLVDGGLVDPVPVSLCRAMGAEIVIAVNLNGNIVGKHSRNRTKKSQTQQPSFWDKIYGQLKVRLESGKPGVLSQWLGNNQKTPGLFEVLAGSINIMQDRITRSRMAGDPPDFILSPHLSKLGLMEFDQAAMAIEEGRKSVQNLSSSLEMIKNN
ncbi:MAG: patatin-like phospholipase RssA [Gammaproteobacteria bacterium]|nr:patatin-like phospholipase RssA [Gammaproteobacteria bacterium]